MQRPSGGGLADWQTMTASNHEVREDVPKPLTPKLWKLALDLSHPSGFTGSWLRVLNFCCIMALPAVKLLFMRMKPWAPNKLCYNLLGG